MLERRITVVCHAGHGLTELTSEQYSQNWQDLIVFGLAQLVRVMLHGMALNTNAQIVNHG